MIKNPKTNTVRDYRVKMSVLLDVMRKDPLIIYLCYAGLRAYQIETDDDFRRYTVSESTKNSLFSFMPGHIRKDSESMSLRFWFKNVPGHLRYGSKENHARDFRMKFLEWAINKFGDQELSFDFNPL